MPAFDDIWIEPYLTKSIVVRGNTEQYKNSMKILGGKWNARLNDKDGEKFGGWIFMSSKKQEIEDWKAKGVHLTSTEQSTSYSNREINVDHLLREIKRLNEKYDRLEKIVMEMKGQSSKKTDSFSEDEEVLPTCRLLKK